MWAQMITAVLMTVAGRVMTALGLSFITYVGLNELQGYFISSISAQIGGISNDALQIMYIAGLGVCLNWIFGTFTFIASIKTMGKLTASISKK